MDVRWQRVPAGSSQQELLEMSVRGWRSPVGTRGREANREVWKVSQRPAGDEVPGLS